MPPSSLVAASFSHPWADLRERLESAVRNLNTLRAQSADPADQTRLTWKREGVEAARDVWERLNDQIADGTSDHAGAWRTFTADVTALFDAPADDLGFYQGVHLALTYQRGYGPDVDAPRIENPRMSQ